MGKKPVVIGIAGGSGSGTTSVTNSMYEKFTGPSILMLQQD
ncbi:uridine kinase, partial [Bacillus altitudinis]|nr:uridine kinase [Bacillus altitudinis]